MFKKDNVSETLHYICIAGVVCEGTQGRMYRKKSRLDGMVCLLINFIAIAVSFYFAIFIRSLMSGGEIVFRGSFVIYSIIALLWAVLFFMSDSFHHFSKRNKFDELMASLKLNAYVFFVFLAVQYFFQMKQVSRIVLIVFPLINVFVVWYTNILYKKILFSRVKGRKNANQCLLLVSSEKAHEVVETILKEGDFNHNLVGYIVYDQDCQGSFIAGIPCVAAGGELIEYCRQNVVDEVFIYLNDDINEKNIEIIIDQLGEMGINALLSLKGFEWEIKVNSKRMVDKLGFYTVMVFSNNIISFNQYIIKRIIDIVGAIVGIIICLVLGIFIAPAIVIEDGFPIIFKQKRVGKNGRIFNFYKFRSMRKDAEEKKAELMEQNEMQGHMFKMENDPRVTKVGRFLRRTSLDEFPQFFSILKGDMSLVGTRPPTVQEYEQYSAYHKKRLSFKPGLTGNWQVSGRSDITDFEEIVKLDVAYIDNWSLKKDFYILLKTVKIVFMGKGAK